MNLGFATSVSEKQSGRTNCGTRSRCTVILIAGVLALQMAFILSYVGAVHAPTPSEISLAVVASEQVSSQLLPELNGIDGTPLPAAAVPDEATADTADTLLLASGGGPSMSSAVQTVITEVNSAQQRTVTVEDLVPLEPGDGRGLTGFYLVIIGGYLVAALLGVPAGSRPANRRAGALLNPRVGAEPSSSARCWVRSPTTSWPCGRSGHCWSSPRAR